MQRLRVPLAQDVVRLLRPTAEEGVFALKEYYETQPAFNYGPARAMAEPVYSGELSLKAALERCKTRGNPVGRKSNAEVAAHIWRAAQGRSFHCHPLTPRPFGIRRDISILVDPLFFFVEDRLVKIFWLQPRRRYSPSLEGLGILAVMIQMTFCEDFDAAELELLDLRIPDGAKERASRIYRFGDLPAVPQEAVTAALERFAQSYDQVCQMGVVRPARRRRRPDDRPEPELF